MPEEQEPITPEILTNDPFDEQALVQRAFDLPDQESGSQKEKQQDERGKENEGDEARYKFSLRIKVGDITLSNLQGDIIDRFVLREETRQYANAEFTIKDRDGSILAHALESENIEIELGFVNGKKVNVFTGKRFSVGRRGVDGTIFRVVDASKGIDSVSSGTSTATESPKQPIKEKTESLEKVRQQISDLKEKKNTIKSALEEAKLNNEEEKISKNKKKLEGIEKELKNLQQKKEDLTSKEQSEDDSEEEPGDREQPDFFTQSFSNTGIGKLFEKMDWVSQQMQDSDSEEYEFLSHFVGNASGTDGRPLKFAQNTDFSTATKGSVFLQTGIMSAAKKKAAEQGDEIVARGNTVRQVAPGKEENSGIVLSYRDNRYAFIGYPEFVKRSPIRRDSGYGSVTVRGYSVTDKDNIGATVVTQPDLPNASDAVEVPEWGEINLDSPIVDGSPYTWADATKGGRRVPVDSEVMEGIVKIADMITKLTKRSGKEKWDITSWYRTPAVNLQVASSGANGPHTTGTAVDFGYVGGNPTCLELYYELEKDHEGGIAIHPALKQDPSQGFVHIDLRKEPPRRRWTY